MHSLPGNARSRRACPSREILNLSAGACRALIPMHKDLRLSGQLPPLDAPHHMRATEWGVFREGVVLSSAPGAGSLLDIGLDKVCCSPSSKRVSEWRWLADPESCQLIAYSEERWLTSANCHVNLIHVCTDVAKP